MAAAMWAVLPPGPPAPGHQFSILVRGAELTPPPPVPPLGAAPPTIAFHAASTMAVMLFAGAPTIVAANAPPAPPEPFLPSMFSRALANAVEFPDATAAVSLARSAAPPTTSLTRPVMAVIGFGIPPSAYPGTPTAAKTGARARECAAETTVSSLLTRARTSSEAGPVPCVIFPPLAMVNVGIVGPPSLATVSFHSRAMPLSYTVLTRNLTGVSKIFWRAPHAAVASDWSVAHFPLTAARNESMWVVTHEETVVQAFWIAVTMSPQNVLTSVHIVFHEVFRKLMTLPTMLLTHE